MKFFDALGAFGENIALIDRLGQHVTYRQLAADAGRFADAVGGGSRRLVLIMCANNVESLAGYLGTLRSGNTALLLAADTDRAFLDNLIELYRPDYIWSGAASGRKTAFVYGDYGLQSLSVERKVAINRNLALLLSTSGSTGSPKMVRLTGMNLEANAASIAEYLGLGESDRPITCLPMHYSFGLSVINSHLKIGATLILTNDAIVTRPFWDCFKTHRATSFSGVPYTYEMLRRLKFFDMALPDLRTMTQAGGKLAPKYVLEFAEFARRQGVDFYVMYGQTEATARMSYLPVEDNVSKCDSIGVAIPGGELYLVDGFGRPINHPGVDGELVYRGSNVMMGYAESEKDLARDDELDGVLHTGDIARFDEDRYFYITGRMKRFVKIYGNRVNLDEIEQYLKAQGFDCVCGGADDLLVVAFTETGRGEKIKNAVLTRYGFHHSVVRVAEVDEIPKNSSGKIQYDRLLEEVLA
ncbi:MAG: AMP-binding protein [candidate division Zixibacteria bacterium]|nr:AMP-binding protein [candidate division Zixibacteria bacterium]